LSGEVIFGLCYVVVDAREDRVPLVEVNLRRHGWGDGLATVVFSGLHVVSMVALRHGVYGIMGESFDFGHWGVELWYEYRKDVVTYVVFVLLLSAYGYHLDRQQANGPTDRRIRVKNKQGVFWLHPAEIITVESGGNYIYFHTAERVLPMRGTLADAEQSLDPAVFIRTHRSFIVNWSHIERLQKNQKDATELCLPNGKVVPVSKKYRPGLMAVLSPQS